MYRMFFPFRFCAAFTDILGIHRPNSATKIKGGNTVTAEIIIIFFIYNISFAPYRNGSVPAKTGGYEKTQETDIRGS